MVAALLAGCGKAKEEAAETEAPTPVLVETAVLGAIDHVVTADAVLFPINQSSVTPKISAPVKRVLVNRGDHVRAGQLIAELESSDLAAALEEAKYQYRTSAIRIRDGDWRNRSRRPDQGPSGCAIGSERVRRRQETVRQPGRAAKRRSSGAKTSRRDQTADGPGANPVGDGAAALEVAERGRPARGDPGRPGTDERGQSSSGCSRSAAFLCAGSQPDQRRCRRPASLCREKWRVPACR